MLVELVSAKQLACWPNLDLWEIDIRLVSTVRRLSLRDTPPKKIVSFLPWEQRRKTPRAERLGYTMKRQNGYTIQNQTATLYKTKRLHSYTIHTRAPTQ
jgi:hypothetical protein